MDANIGAPFVHDVRGVVIGEKTWTSNIPTEKVYNCAYPKKPLLSENI